MPKYSKYSNYTVNYIVFWFPQKVQILPSWHQTYKGISGEIAWAWWFSPVSRTTSTIDVLWPCQSHESHVESWWIPRSWGLVSIVCLFSRFRLNPWFDDLWICSTPCCRISWGLCQLGVDLSTALFDDGQTLLMLAAEQGWTELSAAWGWTKGLWVGPIL